MDEEMREWLRSQDPNLSGCIPTHEKFRQLIRVLEGVSDWEFDLGRWGAECGTPACSAGWAARDDWFQFMGYKFNKSENHSLFRSPGYDNGEGFKAVSDFFGIHYHVANNLFDGGMDFWNKPVNKVSPKDVISKIKELELDRPSYVG